MQFYKDELLKKVNSGYLNDDSSVYDRHGLSGPAFVKVVDNEETALERSRKASFEPIKTIE